MGKNLALIIFQVSSVILCLTLYISSQWLDSYGVFSWLDSKAVDMLLRIQPPLSNSSSVGIIAADSESIAKLGRWPWSRGTIAQILENLIGYYQVKVVGMDILFSEPDQTFQQGVKAISSLSQQIHRKYPYLKGKLDQFQKNAQRAIDGDAKLERVIKQSDRIILGYFFDEQSQPTLYTPKEFNNRSASNLIFDSDIQSVNLNPKPSIQHNLTRFINQQQLSGFFSVYPDNFDGNIRHIPLVMPYGGKMYPSLALQTFRKYISHDQELESVYAYFSLGDLVQVSVGSYTFPVLPTGEIWLRFYGRQKFFTHYSAYDILKKKIPKNRLKDNAVFFGITDMGSKDIRAVPTDNIYPGVEIHATAFKNFLDGNYLTYGGTNQLISIFAILFGGLVSIITLKRSILGVLVTFLFLQIYILLNVYAFFEWNTIASISYVSVVTLFNALVTIIFQLYFQEKDKRFIRNAFQHYISPQVVEILEKNPEFLELGGKLEHLTVFFCDLAGFSSISEKYSPNQVVEIINTFLTEVSGLIPKWDGTIDKFEGDAIMAFWGAPLPLENHAQSACYATLEMQEHLQKLNESFRAKKQPELYARFGLNTGSVIVGNLGSSTRFDYTVIGDPVNIASRLEGVNKVYGTQIVISETTYQECQDSIEVRELDWITVAGRQEPLVIYELIGRCKQISKKMWNLRRHYLKGLEEYRNERWGNALRLFQKCLKIVPDDQPSKIFISRCKEYIENPPQTWDGVYQMRSK